MASLKGKAGACHICWGTILTALEGGLQDIPWACPSQPGPKWLANVWLKFLLIFSVIKGSKPY